MKTFLINLDKDKERLVSADSQLRKLGVDYERFPAIYAKDLPQDEINANVDYFRWWCCIGVPILKGEIGCALSHYAIMRKMIEDDIKVACILEDDIILTEYFKERVNQVEEQVDLNKPQVILLSNHTGESEERQGIFRINNGLCTEGYILTQIAAKALLKENMPIKVPCDKWSRWAKKGVIELFTALPSVCAQNWDGFESNMFDAKSRCAVKDMTFFKKFGHKCKRCIGTLIDLILLTLGK